MSERLPVCTARTRHSRLARTWFCVGKPKSEATQKWRHLNGRQVIVAMHGNKQIPIGTLKSIIEGAGCNCRRFPLKQIRGLADERRLQVSRRRGSNFFIRGTSSVTNSSGFLRSSSGSVRLSLVRERSQVRVRAMRPGISQQPSTFRPDQRLMRAWNPAS